MKREISRYVLLSTVGLLVLLLGAGTVSAGEEAKSDKDKAKETKQTARKAEAKEEPPVSEIFQAARKPKTGESEEVVVFTNDALEDMIADLPPEKRLQGVYQAERHVGSPQPQEGGAGEQKTAPAGGDSLEWLEQQQTAATERKVELSDAQKNVSELQAKVTELERRALTIRNPLMPRRYSERNPEDAEDWDKENSQQRLETTQAELDKARQELAAAQKDLARLRGAGR
jgi:hypothetical protein